MSSDIYQHSFYEKQISCDLEINTLDDQQLYVNKYLLCLHSPYFKALLTNGCSETNSNSIKLSHTSHVLNIVLNILCFCYKMNLHNECLKKINNIDLLHDYFSTCEEYQLYDLKESAQNYFSSAENLQIIIHSENNDTASFITTILTFELKQIKKAYNDIIDKKIISIESVNFNNINIRSVFEFFNTWRMCAPAFIGWLKDRDPTDEELSSIRHYTFKDVPKDLVEILIRRIRKFTKATIFKSRVLENLTYSIYPEITKE
jgi:hypothetical protein